MTLDCKTPDYVINNHNFILVAKYGWKYY